MGASWGLFVSLPSRSPTAKPRLARRLMLGSPTVRVLGRGSRHWELLRMILDECQVRAGLVTGALCHEHGVTMVLSNDRDFDRFPDIRGGRLGS